MENETKKQVWRITDANKFDNGQGGWIYIGIEDGTSDIDVNWRENTAIKTFSEAIEIALDICELLNSKTKQDGN